MYFWSPQKIFFTLLHALFLHLYVDFFHWFATMPMYAWIWETLKSQRPVFGLCNRFEFRKAQIIEILACHSLEHFYFGFCPHLCCFYCWEILLGQSICEISSSHIPVIVNDDIWFGLHGTLCVRHIGRSVIQTGPHVGKCYFTDFKCN